MVCRLPLAPRPTERTRPAYHAFSSVHHTRMREPMSDTASAVSACRVRVRVRVRVRAKARAWARTRVRVS
jgi:hypothetical protein